MLELSWVTWFRKLKMATAILVLLFLLVLVWFCLLLTYYVDTYRVSFTYRIVFVTAFQVMRRLHHLYAIYLFTMYILSVARSLHNIWSFSFSNTTQSHICSLYCLRFLWHIRARVTEWSRGTRSRGVYFIFYLTFAATARYSKLGCR